MNTFLIIIPIIILFLIISLTTSIIVYKNKNKNNLIQINSINQKIDCPLSTNSLILKKCEPSDVNSCNNCSDTLNFCITVDEKNPYIFKKDDGTKGLIPNGNWCLPASLKDGICNPFSGYPILTKLNNTEYTWKCQCKYPSLFKNKGVFGDCTSPVACFGGDLVSPSDNENCKQGEKWLECPKWDPKDGVCSCPENTMYLDRSDINNNILSKQCVLDYCSPGQTNYNNYNTNTNTNINCICPNKYKDETGYKSFINCPGDLPTATKDDNALCVKDIPRCIEDPCNPGGYWDTTQNTCICDKNEGYISIQDSNSLVKSICIKPCANDPCQAVAKNCIPDKDQYSKDKTYFRCENCIYPQVADKYQKNNNNKCYDKLKPEGYSCSDSWECQTGKCAKVDIGIGQYRHRCVCDGKDCNITKDIVIT